jgi:hypothetical protein
MGVGMGVGTQAALDRPTVDPCLRSLQIMAPNLNITFTWPNAFHSDRSGKCCSCATMALPSFLSLRAFSVLI